MCVWKILYVCVLAIKSESASTCTSSTRLFEENFSRFKDGPLSRTTLVRQVPRITLAVGTESNMAIKSESLVLKYPSGCVGTAYCAYQWRAALKHTDHFKYSYSFRLGKQFEFVKGGKLPGVCGNTCPTGGRDPSKGFSSRNMWREGGRFVSYLYNPGVRGRDLQWKDTKTGKDIILQRDVWTNIEVQIKLNKVGSNNGYIHGYFNGRLSLKHAIVWRKLSNVHADAFYLSTFYGGKGASWAPRKDNYIAFDDIRVCAL